jgi:glutamate transport system permease protein
MIENESNALMSVFALFALGFVALTLPTGLLLGWLARRAGVRR